MSPSSFMLRGVMIYLRTLSSSPNLITRFIKTLKAVIHQLIKTPKRVKLVQRT